MKVGCFIYRDFEILREKKLKIKITPLNVYHLVTSCPITGVICVNVSKSNNHYCTLAYTDFQYVEVMFIILLSGEP